MPDSESDHKAIVTKLFEDGWNKGRTDSFDNCLADTVQFDHAGTTRSVSRQGMSEAVGRWRSAFPDLRMEVDELIEEDGLLAARARLSGTHTGMWNEIAPTGKRVQMALMMFFRFEQGKLVELWEVDDQLGLRRQLGLTW